MFLLWLIGFVICSGLVLAWLRAKASKTEEEHWMGGLEWDEEGGLIVIVVAIIFSLVWPISLPLWWVYSLGKRIFK